MSTRAAALVVAAASILIYWGALSSGFVGDDFMILHRLRDAGGIAGAGRFFRGEFFDYYRPLGFVVHALDWTIAGDSARQFHLTNILLHAVNGVLVLLIGRQLAPRTAAGPIAALLFAFHASNHEAVVWISARFDLLATGLSLAALLCTLRGSAILSSAGAVLFLGALLSKESAVAMPLAAAGAAVFVERASTWQAVRRVAPWIAALVVYSVLRSLAGGISATGGASRLPKLTVFALLLAVIVAAGGGRWERVRVWLRINRGPALLALAAILAAAALAALAGGRLGTIAAEKLAVAGFALLHLGSPWVDLFALPFYLDPGGTMYWLGGTIVAAVALAIAGLVWCRASADDRVWFLGTLLVAALLPISALTEGARYLYLPSAALSLAAGVLIADLRERARTIAIAALAVFLAISSAQILIKVRDWQWAGRLTAQGARLVDAALAPACGEGHVVFLTEPVAIRSVYTHFLYETFEMPRGCMPEVFQYLVRVLRVNTAVEARWDGPSRIVLTTPSYRGNFSLSGDLRHFDPPLKRGQSSTVMTPLGELRAEPAGPLSDGEQLTLTLAPAVDAARIRWFYYSDGAIRPLAK